VTLFNRGQTNTHLFPGVEKLIGDRAKPDLESLKGKVWDAVIDNSATDPNWVRDTAQLLKDSVRNYVFISTRSAYRDLSQVPATINSPVHTRESTPVQEGRPLPYGLAKAEAERETMRAFGDRAIIVRPGLIVGPGDDTDRFTYWPLRIDRGGEVLAPGDGSDHVMVIDVRDLSEWVVRLVEQGAAGTYNGVGPEGGRSMAEFLYGIRAVTTSVTKFTWVDTAFLDQHNVRGYSEMPVWRPARGNMLGFARFDLTNEVKSGLTFRPLAVTARDTLDWYYARPTQERERVRAGITAEREKEVLAAWHAAKKA
ncbi:MAG: NAD-dependent epimerase/dehydratase family protein, partial [Longimicrobiales bacterium]